jgi:drug/metabolite transporter (DMT)-like permease
VFLSPALLGLQKPIWRSADLVADGRKDLSDDSQVRSRIVAGVPPGLALAAGYLAQTAGLKYTTASKAGLLTGLFVVLTPLLVFLLWRRAPDAATIVAVAGALAGTAMLVGPGVTARGSQEALGDALEVLTALAFSIHILLLARFAPGRNPAVLAWVQMLVAAIIFSVAAGSAGEFHAPAASVWIALGVTGVVASALAFWVQTAVQQRISPSRTAIVLVAEPAFAAFFGLVLAGDRFGVVQGSGAVLILAAIAYHEWVSPPSVGGSEQGQRGAETVAG